MTVSCRRSMTREKSRRHIAWPNAHPALPATAAPSAVTLFLTSHCTLRCLYCYAEGGKNPREMPWDTVTGVIDALLRYAVEQSRRSVTVHFHGGGDVSACWLLFVRACDYLHARAKEQQLAVTTTAGLNGMLDDAQREWLMRNIDDATVSLDGLPEIQDRLRPRVDHGPSFPMVDATLRAFDAAGFQYGLRGTVTAGSVEQLPASVAFICERYQVKKIKMEPMHPRGRGAGESVQPPAPNRFCATIGQMLVR